MKKIIILDLPDDREFSDLPDSTEVFTDLSGSIAAMVGEAMKRGLAWPAAADNVITLKVEVPEDLRDLPELAGLNGSRVNGEEAHLVLAMVTGLRQRAAAPDTEAVPLTDSLPEILAVIEKE